MVRDIFQSKQERNNCKYYKIKIKAIVYIKILKLHLLNFGKNN